MTCLVWLKVLTPRLLASFYCLHPGMTEFPNAPASTLSRLQKSLQVNFVRHLNRNVFEKVVNFITSDRNKVGVARMMDLKNDIRSDSTKERAMNTVLSINKLALEYRHEV